MALMSPYLAVDAIGRFPLSAGAAIATPWWKVCASAQTGLLNRWLINLACLDFLFFKRGLFGLAGIFEAPTRPQA